MFYVKFGLHVHLLLAFAKKVMYVFFFNIYMYWKGLLFIEKVVNKNGQIDLSAAKVQLNKIPNKYKQN